MTARRRRKSGSGPSATALIAWVEGTGYGPEDAAAWPAGPTAVGALADAAAQPQDRPPLVSKARGLAAGTLLACGSVLAVAVHAADSSGPPQAAASPKLVTVDPSDVSGGHAATSVVSSTATPPAATRAQALGGEQVRSGDVPRNIPQAIGGAGALPQSQQQAPPRMSGADHEQQTPAQDPVGRAISPVTEPVAQAPRTIVGAVGELVVPQGRGLSPAGSAVQQAAPAVGALVEQVVPAAQAPVGEVLAPLADVVPLQEGAQPALTMLSPLPLG